MLALVVLAFAAVPVDPCALRALAQAPSTPLLAKLKAIDATKDPRAYACMAVVAANALAREGHGSDAAALYDAAAAGALSDLDSSLTLAKNRALAPPKPAPVPDDKLPAPKSAAACADRVQGLLRASKLKRAATLAVSCAPDASASAGNEALSVATVTALVRAGRVDEGLKRAATLDPSVDALAKVRAWALAKAGKGNDARDAYAALAARTSDPALKAEATFYAAFSVYEVGALDDARARFLASDDALKGSPFEAFGRWYPAFIDLLEGKPK
ncbi:MAG TPA: hypothetical protein VGO62_18570, partial [Myxococcota bacterium]